MENVPAAGRAIHARRTGLENHPQAGVDASSSAFYPSVGLGRMRSPGWTGEGQRVNGGEGRERDVKEPNLLAFRNLTLGVLSSWILFANQKWGKILVTS